MAGKAEMAREAADSTGKTTTSTPRGSRRALDHAWGPRPRVVEGPARPDCGIGGSPGRRKPSGAAGAHKNRCDCCPPAA